MAETQMPRDCANCPSFLKRKEATEYLKADPGASICGTHGHILDRKGMELGHKRRIQRKLAESCTTFGEAPPEVARPTKLGFNVVMPDPDAMTYEATEYDERRVLSCQACEWFVAQQGVEDNFGWKGGVCRAKGKLISDKRLELEAQSCGNRKHFYSYGDVRGADSLTLIPILHDNFAPKFDPLATFRESRENFVDPREFTSSMPVSEDEREAGIRAWRELEDPSTGNVVQLPVYDFNSFSPELQALIPQTGDDEHPELYVDHANAAYKIAVLWRELDETPAAWGMPGTGKTELFRYLAWMMVLPFHRISITGSTEVDDLVGKTMFSKEKGTYYQPGRLVHGWESPGVICIDEPNTGPADVWQLLRPLTDNSKQLVLDQDNGRRVERHSESYLGFAMNPSWDARNIAAEPLADADVSRLMHLEIGIPPEDVEREIIRNRCKEDGFQIEDDQVDLMLRVAHDIRDLSNEGVFPGTWGVRNSVKCARLLKFMAPSDALMLGVGNFLEPSQREKLLDTLNTAME